MAACETGVGYGSVSPLAGALAGGLAGLQADSPSIRAVGARAGLIGGLYGESEAKKAAKKRIAEQLKALHEAYAEQRREIESLSSSLRQTPTQRPFDALCSKIAAEVERGRGYGCYETSLTALMLGIRI